MKAFVTSTGEPTTELCVWALKRQGFDVVLLKSDSSLAEKLKDIYNFADDDFIRIDADIIVNKNFTIDLIDELKNDDKIWWWQFNTFDWYKQDISNSIAFIRKEALPALRKNINNFQDNIRPETESSRIKELNKPRRMKTYTDEIIGIHGYGIKDIKPVIKLKAERGQSHLYDFELAKRLGEL